MESDTQYIFNTCQYNYIFKIFGHNFPLTSLLCIPFALVLYIMYLNICVLDICIF